MRRKRQGPIPVELSQTQRARLKDLRFVYGGHGPKSTMENHSFTRGFLERDSDERGFYRPTEERLAAVDHVLGVRENSG